VRDFSLARYQIGKTACEFLKNWGFLKIYTPKCIFRVQAYKNKKCWFFPWCAFACCNTSALQLPVISSLHSFAQLLVFPAQLFPGADQEMQRADHGKPKSWAKNRHISGRNALLGKFWENKHYIMNWKIFGAF
jgi:hypothetical protein